MPRRGAALSPRCARGRGAGRRRRSRPARRRRREAAWRENNLGVALLEQFRFADGVRGVRARAREGPGAAARPGSTSRSPTCTCPTSPPRAQAAEAALKAAPDAPQPNYILALIARTEGRAEEALPYVQKVLAQDPKDLGANVTLGQVYLQMRAVRGGGGRVPDRGARPSPTT